MNIVTLVVLFIVRLISMLPLNMIGKIGSALGVVGFYLAKNRRNVGLKNLSLCFPQMSIDEKRSIIKQHFKYLVTSALEYGLVFYAKPERLRQFIHLKNFEYVLEHYGNRPVILLCPHFVGLDLGAIRLTLDIVGFSIYSRQKNSLITEKLKEARIRFIKDQGGAVFARQDGLRPILKRLKETKQVFYYLPDQDFGERDSIYVP
ncbi:MAG: Kdo2-lipid lauroyltransferase/acyltransferase, partial [Pseudomonadota bacterium]|nr:Kdo2-lipid lauroyltransferase/acyltransferase [Pseudomonadota bacterium]